MIPYDVISDRFYNDPMKLVQKYTKFALILTKKPKTRKVCDTGSCVKPGTLTLNPIYKISDTNIMMPNRQNSCVNS